MRNLVVGRVRSSISETRKPTNLLFRSVPASLLTVRGEQYHEFRMCITTFGDGSPLPRHFHDGWNFRSYFFEPNYGRFAEFWITVLLRTESTIII